MVNTATSRLAQGKRRRPWGQIELMAVKANKQAQPEINSADAAVEAAAVSFDFHPKTDEQHHE